ncbi:MAG TPA: YbaY family lipoprotein [Pseudoxanthomonas sp.]|nr:YbaY family lipoprotein [Pseudoxanthomonas sp.]
MRRATVVACLSLALAACQPTPPPPAPVPESRATAQAPAQTSIQGTATYRERISLPAGTQLQVQLVDRQLADSPAAVVASIDIPATQGPPFAFSLPFDPAKLRANGEYGLHASLRDADGRLWFVTDTHTPATPGSSAPVQVTLVRVQTDARAHMTDTRWLCGEQRVAARFDPEPANTVTLSLGGPPLVLNQATSGSGARYTDKFNNEFWNKGRDARLTLAGKAAVDCRQLDTASPWDSARSRGQAFRGIGNEPGWLVELGAGASPSLHAELDYGERVVDIAQVTGADGQWSGRSSDGANVRLSVQRQACQDVMSGESMPATVSLVVNEKTYSGCGRYLTE